jgi:hypothetical protein
MTQDTDEFPISHSRVTTIGGGTRDEMRSFLMTLTGISPALQNRNSQMS